MVEILTFVAILMLIDVVRQLHNIYRVVAEIRDLMSSETALRKNPLVMDLITDVQSRVSHDPKRNS